MKKHYPNNHAVAVPTLDAIRKRHPLTLEAVQCGPSALEIGYGHRYSVFPGQRITAQQAEDLFRADVMHCEAYIRSRIMFPLSDGRYQAFVSFLFDVGPRAAFDHCHEIFVPDMSDAELIELLPRFASCSRFRDFVGASARAFEGFCLL